MNLLHKISLHFLYLPSVQEVVTNKVSYCIKWVTTSWAYSIYTKLNRAILGELAAPGGTIFALEVLVLLALIGGQVMDSDNF